MKNFGVSQKAVLFDSGGKLLALQRSNTHPYKPLTWDLPGGDLSFGEDPLAGIVREVNEETGLNVRGLKPFDVEAQVTPNNDFWITIAYRTQNFDGDIKLSYEHSDFKWLSPQEFLSLESAPKLKRFIQNTINK
ncbi:MAG: NUDIX hydrolase [bacterium]|nr:NUDIX hydrolase [bacterium]